MATKKLPKYVFQRQWGSYQYKRNVPNRLKTHVGKATLYRFLGKSYDEMIVNLPVVHREIEEIFNKLDGETSRDRTVALVEANFGKRAAQMLEADDVDENLEMAMWALGHELEDDKNVDQMAVSHLIGGRLPFVAFSLSHAIDLYGEFKDAADNKKTKNQLAKIAEDLKASIGEYCVPSSPLRQNGMFC